MNPVIAFPILVFVSVVGLGGAGAALVAAHRRSVAARLRSIREDQSPDAGVADGEVGMLGAVARIGDAAGAGKASVSLKEKLYRAGFVAPSAVAIFLGSKIVLLLIGVASSVSLILWRDWPIALEIWLVAGVSGLLFFLPNLVVGRHRRKRVTEVRQSLPIAVDLIEVCVSSGMGMDMAWTAVADEIRGVSAVLADEMSLMSLEMQLGASRTEAMRHLVERSGAEELTGLIALLVQSERFGASVSDALRTFATSMRETRSMRAEERAEKTAVKLLFPLVLIIFPVMLIVMVGPAIITLQQIFAQS